MIEKQAVPLGRILENAGLRLGRAVAGAKNVYGATKSGVKTLLGAIPDSVKSDFKEYSRGRNILLPIALSPLFFKLGYDMSRRGLGCKQAAEDKKSRMSPEKRRQIGNYLMLAGLLGPSAVFGGRGLYLGHKAKKLMRAGALGSTQEIDRYIADSLARSGKTLPKYEWVRPNSVVTPGAVPVISSRADYINRAGKHKLLRLLARLQTMSGPHYAPDLVGPGHIFTDGCMNPKVLMHELGHAHSPKNIGELWAIKHDGIFKRPKNNKLYQEEVRAWDNAGIGEGDPVREAALATYRNALYGRQAGAAASPVALSGYLMRRGAKADESQG